MVNSTQDITADLSPRVDEGQEHPETLRQRLEAISGLNQIFIRASSEKEIIQGLLQTSLQHTQALGTSYVPLDQRGLPLTAISQGQTVTPSAMEAWVEYLAAPSIHAQCKICRRDQLVTETCPLLSSPFSDSVALFCLHLRTSGSRLGVLNLYLPRGKDLDSGTRSFLQTILDSAALGIENLRLRKNEKQILSKLRPAAPGTEPDSSRVAEIKLKTTLEERSRLAREIHDGLAQVLGFLKLQLSQMDALLKSGEDRSLSDLVQSSHRAVSEAYIDAREAIDDLHPNPLRVDFSTWLQETGLLFEENFNIRIDISGLPSGFSLPPDIQIQVSRIIQETLSNIRKHARAQRVHIRFQKEGRSIILNIQDDGIGFQPGDYIQTSQHGIHSMRERALLIGSLLKISSQPGAGTTIQIHIPDERLAQV